jgi:cyclic pyranopterin phosphate synthase
MASDPPHFSHLDPLGHAQMVDVTDKTATCRSAVAEGEIHFSGDVAALLSSNANPKGDAFTVAKIAGIQAAKQCAHLIPLCHQVALSVVDIQFTLNLEERKITSQAKARTTAGTGVEMEALTAVSVSLLTLYDMMKSADKRMHIGNIRLLSKEGGKSGAFVNESGE